MNAVRSIVGGGKTAESLIRSIEAQADNDIAFAAFSMTVMMSARRRSLPVIQSSAPLVN